MKAIVPLLLCSLLAGCATYQWRHEFSQRYCVAY